MINTMILGSVWVVRASKTNKLRLDMSWILKIFFNQSMFIFSIISEWVVNWWVIVKWWNRKDMRRLIIRDILHRVHGIIIDPIKHLISLSLIEYITAIIYSLRMGVILLLCDAMISKGLKIRFTWLDMKCSLESRWDLSAVDTVLEIDVPSVGED